MADDTEVESNPELERRTRRKFSSADKQRLLAEYDNRCLSRELSLQRLAL